jgi:hypothetical protein
MRAGLTLDSSSFLSSPFLFPTGSLAAKVSAYPPFPGSEGNFLRCQIARIAADTVVCPAGYFTAGDDGATLEKAAEFSAPDMSELSAWCHRYPSIKGQGRCAVFEPPPPEGEEEPVPLAEELTAVVEGGAEILAGVDADAEIEEGVPSWAVITSSSVVGVKYKVTGVRSTLWPGAYAVAAGTVFSNMYVGYGVKNAPFVPAPPPALQPEYEGAMEESKELPPRPDEPVEEEPPAEE